MDKRHAGLGRRLSPVGLPLPVVVEQRVQRDGRLQGLAYNVLVLGHEGETGRETASIIAFSEEGVGMVHV
jgi:hypothetical protein